MFGQGIFSYRRRNTISRIYHENAVGVKKNTEIDPLNAASYDFDYDDDNYDDEDEDACDELETNHSNSNFKGKWLTCRNYCNNYFSYMFNEKLKDLFRWFMDYAYYEFRISVGCTYFVTLFF